MYYPSDISAISSAVAWMEGLARAPYGRLRRNPADQICSWSEKLVSELCKPVLPAAQSSQHWPESSFAHRMRDSCARGTLSTSKHVVWI